MVHINVPLSTNTDLSVPLGWDVREHLEEWPTETNADRAITGQCWVDLDRTTSVQGDVAS
jgi:hypothetical protein